MIRCTSMAAPMASPDNLSALANSGCMVCFTLEQKETKETKNSQCAILPGGSEDSVGLATFDRHRRWPAMTTMCPLGAFRRAAAGRSNFTIGERVPESEPLVLGPNPVSCQP